MKTPTTPFTVLALAAVLSGAASTVRAQILPLEGAGNTTWNSLDGTWTSPDGKTVVPDDFMGPIGPDQIRQSDATRSLGPGLGTDMNALTSNSLLQIPGADGPSFPPNDPVAARKEGWTEIPHGGAVSSWTKEQGGKLIYAGCAGIPCRLEEYDAKSCATDASCPADLKKLIADKAAKEKDADFTAKQNTEMFGGETLIRQKAKTPEIAEKILGFIRAMEKRILACGVDLRGSQPTGDNIAGGLSTIEEKALGAMQKWGTKPIVGALEYAERVGDESGLWIMDTPGHGGESITGIAAAGSQVMSFSTGGGHTINHPLMITMRITGNRESWEKMQETMEVDVSDMFEGTSLDEAGERLFHEVLDLCDGRMTKAEALKEFNAFAINRCGPSV